MRCRSGKKNLKAIKQCIKTKNEIEKLNKQIKYLYLLTLNYAACHRADFKIDFGQNEPQNGLKETFL